MPELTWLHISDLHCCEARTGWSARNVLATLREDLESMAKAHHMIPDLLFFTGDAAFGDLPGHPIGRQFDEALSFLKEIQNLCKIPDENVFLVPGNHDVNRNKISQMSTGWLMDLCRKRDRDAIHDLFEKGSKDLKLIMDRLSDYRGFLDRADYRHLLGSGESRGSAGLIYAHRRTVHGLDVGIAGLNTAWSCHGDGEKGQLWMAGRWQVETLEPALKDAQLRIVLTHHPLSWLCEAETDLGRLFETVFDFHLYGHEHMDWVRRHGAAVEVAAGACYERADRDNGYNLVHVDSATGKAEVWLRNYDHVGRGWVQRIIAGVTDDHGIWHLQGLRCAARQRFPGSEDPGFARKSTVTGTSTERIYVVYACEDRSTVRSLVQSCRRRGVTITWDQDWDPWDDARWENPFQGNGEDIVAFYGSESLFRDSLVRSAFEKAKDLGRRIVILDEFGRGPEAFEGADLVPFDSKNGANALIDYLRLATRETESARDSGDVHALLHQAHLANLGIPTDTITERLFMTSQAVDLTRRAFEVSRETRGAGIDENDRFRANLEYGRLLRFSGQWDEASYHLKMLMLQADLSLHVDPDLRHLILLERGSLEFERGFIFSGKKDIEEVLAYFESQIGPNLVKALRQLGNMLVEEGEWNRSKDLLNSALYLARVLDSSLIRRGTLDQAAALLRIDCLRELSSLLLRQEKFDESLEHFTRALYEAETIKPAGQHLVGVLCYHIGRLHHLHTGDLRQADEYLERSLDILKRYDNPVRIAFVYENIARVRMRLPPYAGGAGVLEYFERALRIRESCGHTYMIAKTRIELGDFHSGNGGIDEALNEYNAAHKICQEYGKKPELARALYHLGRAHARKSGSRKEARDCLTQAEELFRELGLTSRLREVEFELLKLEEPHLLERSFDEILQRGRDKDYEFCVNEVGEYAVHGFIRKLVDRPSMRQGGYRGVFADVEVGIGDDAAVLSSRDPEKFDMVVTTDAAPGSICRSPDVNKGRYAAKFSVIHSLSDLLSMGATPVAILLNLYMSRDAKLEYAKGVVETVIEEIARYNVALIGGDIKERREQSIGCVGIGLVPRGGAICRKKAARGDVLAITQASMASSKGREPRRIGKRWAQEVLEVRKLTKDAEFKSFFQEGQDWKESLLFLPYEEMLNIVGTGKVTSGIDTSDGVLACLQLVGRESEVAFLLDERLVEQIIDPEVRKVAKQLDLPPALFLFNAGHDWEIVLTVKREEFESVRAVARETGGDLAPIGLVVDRSEIPEPRRGVGYVRANGQQVWLPFFTDEKFVRRPYEDRPFEWEDLKSYLDGREPLPRQMSDKLAGAVEVLSTLK